MAMGSVQALWRRRDLVGALAGSEFKSRYRRLGLGVTWAVLNPLVQSLVIALVFSTLRAFGDLDGVPYVLFLMAGMMPWNFFVSTLTGGTNSLLESRQILQRVAMPRAALPTASLVVNLFNFAFMLGTLLVIVAIGAIERMTQIWMLPLAVALNVGLVYGMTLLTSSLQVRYRDVGQLVGAALLAWFWVTPIVYPITFEPLTRHTLVQSVIRANPMTGIVSLYRAALLRFPVDWVAVGWSAGWAAFFLIVGWVVFSRREATVADFL